MTNTIPVLLLTGYLGSGKTTLLNRILANRRGIKFAVIVNDLGEVNIDADLIQQGGIVDKKDDSLVALQNGCICCTLKMDLVAQLRDITLMDKFDYIVIEASGICEPAPIAQTISTIPQLTVVGPDDTLPRLDCIVTVVDALRMQDEFACGDDLKKENIDDEDLENLVIQQIEFCNIVILNKASEVKPEELERMKEIIRSLQPKAKILQCDYGDVNFDDILDTHMFDFAKVATSAAWIAAIEGEEEEDEPEGEAMEYGIQTYVYYRRPAFNINMFDRFVGKKWPKNIIRAKGICWFSDEIDKCYLFEQAGHQKSIRDAGLWYATMSQERIDEMKEREPALRRDWDPVYGDRMVKIVFIGQDLDKEQLEKDLDECLEATIQQ